MFDVCLLIIVEFNDLVVLDVSYLLRYCGWSIKISSVHLFE